MRTSRSELGHWLRLSAQKNKPEEQSQCRKAQQPHPRLRRSYRLGGYALADRHIAKIDAAGRNADRSIGIRRNFCLVPYQRLSRRACNLTWATRPAAIERNRLFLIDLLFHWLKPVPGVRSGQNSPNGGGVTNEAHSGLRHVDLEHATF